MQIPFTNSYSLNLSNGHRWSILNTDAAASIIAKMAAIMNLGPALKETDARLLFARGIICGNKFVLTGNTFNSDQNQLLKDGWHFNIINGILFLTHPSFSDIICWLGPEGPQETEVLKLGDSLFKIYEYELNFGCIPIHAALIERNGIGVILPARGNTGKSTCCNRIPKPWRALCDDEVFIVRSSDHNYSVHPFPTWSNFTMGRPKMSWDTQYHVPLKAIYFIEQAKHDEAIRITDVEAVHRIFNSSWESFGRMTRYLNPNYKIVLRKQTFINSCELSKSVPSYILKVNLQGKFWEEIDKTLEI